MWTALKIGPVVITYEYWKTRSFFKLWSKMLVPRKDYDISETLLVLE